MSQATHPAATPAATLENLDSPAMLELVRKQADLIDIRFVDDLKVCTYRLEELLIEVSQNRRQLEELTVSIIGTELR